MFWFTFILFLLLASFAYAAIQGAPWVPTRKPDIDRLLRLLDLKPDQKFVELGCGDGRVSLAIAKRTHAQVTGIELSLAQWLIATMRGFLSPSFRKSGLFIFGNVFSQDLSKYDAVYLFLMPDTYAKLRPKFERELRTGSRVISYVWPIQGWEPDKVDEQEGRQKLFLYIRT